MIDRIDENIPSDQIGSVVDQWVTNNVAQRRRYERRWYDNNFFDDGYHFRVISRKTGQVIDHITKLSGYVERAIPRASLQIRGVSNLLYATDPYPVVYPQRITTEDFRDPRTGQIDINSFQSAKESAKQVARKQGIWLTTQWDELFLNLKVIDMILLAARNSVAYVQVYTDVDKQKICLDIFDAFDIILEGEKRELSEQPFITKTAPMSLIAVQNNRLFDPDRVKKLSPDNKYATSEVKDAYMRAKFGTRPDSKEQSTIIVKETFMKEYLSDSNWSRISKMIGDGTGIMDGKSRGDHVMRHVFSAGGVTLNDEYVDYDEYPFADFRFEPGPIYQTPFIERFIPQNKSLDVIVTRLEKWVNSMVVGVYQKRKGEDFQISNFPGGQMIDYEVTPLEQMATSNVGPTPFQVISLLDKYIDEQGATSAALGEIPSGVKSGNAIESLKSSDYANLKIATTMLKKTIKTIATLMLERAHKDFMEPMEVEYLNDSEPDYFDVIGQKGYDLSQKVGKPLPSDTVPLSKDTKVRIEIEPGLGITMEGKRQTMTQIIDFMSNMLKEGAINPDSLKIIIKNFLETFGFGSTQEFMESLDEGATQGQFDEQDIQKLKIAVLEVLRDAQMVGPKAQENQVMASKVGTLESLKEAGVLDKLVQKDKPIEDKKPSESISFKDLPPTGQAQMARQAGIDLSPQEVEAHQKEQQAQAENQQVTAAVIKQATAPKETIKKPLKSKILTKKK